VQRVLDVDVLPHAVPSARQTIHRLSREPSYQGNEQGLWRLLHNHLQAPAVGTDLMPDVINTSYARVLSPLAGLQGSLSWINNPIHRTLRVSLAEVPAPWGMAPEGL
jgi:hypothetical protein